jgi:hypothetical protein
MRSDAGNGKDIGRSEKGLLKSDKNLTSQN